MYIARQAIFDKSLKVYGYELLFRSDNQSGQFDGMSSSQATASVLGGLFELDITHIADDKMAFVNFDEKFLQYDFIELISETKLVIEVLENVTITEQLIDRIKNLKEKGYKIALDDFVESYTTYPLVPLADIIKFDLRATTLESIAADVKVALSQKKIILAEKVETEEEFQQAKQMGFHLFQGFFFSKPSIVGKTSNHTTTKAQYGRLILELKKDEPSYQKLAEIIEKDANLAYRLVHLISSRSKDDLVYSIKRALAYMGLNELERWLNILMLRELSDQKPDELMRISLIRTKFAEHIAINSDKKNKKYEAAILGLFSTLDAMLNQTMDEALKDISLPESIKEALINKSGELAPIYEIMLTYEQGKWDNMEQCCEQIHMNSNLLYEKYMNSVVWANEVMNLIYLASS